MDTLTHALSGALLARASAAESPVAHALPVRRRVAAGFLAAAFPDSDVLIALFADPLTYINLHRGVTHSVLLMPLWALLLAGLFSLAWRRGENWRAYFGVAWLALAIHVAGDVITSYGTQILAPFSNWKASIPTTFIIDPWFTGIIVLGLAGSWYWRRSRLPAVAGLALLGGYVGLQAVLMNQAVATGERYAERLGLEQAQVTALAQPLSPFYWKVVIEQPGRYHVAHLALGRDQVPEAGGAHGLFGSLHAAFRPADSLRWQTLRQFGDDGAAVLAQEAWKEEPLQGFREFARFPVLNGIEERAEGTCVWFHDLRFAMPVPDAVGRLPFRFGVCRGDAGRWQLYRRVGQEAERIVP